MWAYNTFEIFWIPNFSEKEAELLENIGVKLVIEDKILANLRNSIESVDN